MKKTCLSLLIALMLFSLHADSPPITLAITEGSGYTHRKWFGIIPLNLVPQIAVWLEDSQGEFIKTLYITGVSAENSWKGSKERPKLFPSTPEKIIYRRY